MQLGLPSKPSTGLGNASASQGAPPDSLFKRAHSDAVSGMSADRVAKFLTQTKVAMDHVAEAIRDEVTSYRCRTYETFTTKEEWTRLSAAATAKPIHNAAGAFIGFDQYTFGVWGEPDEPTIRVSLGWDGGIRVWRSGAWKSLAEYVSSLPRFLNNSTLESAEGQHNHQWKWWAANGKTFRLLDLPPEIREKLYFFAFGPKIQPYQKCKAIRKLRNLGRDPKLLATLKPNVQLLGIENRQLFAEASHVVYSEIPFLIQLLPQFSGLMRNVAVRSHVRRLELALSHRDFCALFGMSFTANIAYRHVRDATAIRRLRLHSLELCIASTTREGDEVDSWDNVCQKTVVDYMLEAAWPWVKGHPVTVTGQVKTKQKAVFEAACLVERKKVEQWRLRCGISTGSPGEHDEWLEMQPWQKQRIAAGLPEGEWEEYAEWKKEYDGQEEGGVRLVEEEEEFVLSTETGEGASPREKPVAMFKPIPYACRCSTLCTISTWSPED